jgi:hypothetical protein
MLGHSTFFAFSPLLFQLRINHFATRDLPQVSRLYLRLAHLVLIHSFSVLWIYIFALLWRSILRRKQPQIGQMQYEKVPNSPVNRDHHRIEELSRRILRLAQKSTVP